MNFRWVVVLVMLVTLFWAPVQASEGLDIKSALGRSGVRLVVVEFYATWCKPWKPFRGGKYSTINTATRG